MLLHLSTVIKDVIIDGICIGTRWCKNRLSLIRESNEKLSFVSALKTQLYSCCSRGLQWKKLSMRFPPPDTIGIHFLVDVSAKCWPMTMKRGFTVVYFLKDLWHSTYCNWTTLFLLVHENRLNHFWDFNCTKDFQKESNHWQCQKKMPLQEILIK